VTQSQTKLGHVSFGDIRHCFPVIKTIANFTTTTDCIVRKRLYHSQGEELSY